MSNLKLNNLNFNYELFGDETDLAPLVLVGGYACDINFWRLLAEKLSGRRQVLIFDNQGIGQTTDNGDELTLDSMANNIWALIEGLGLKNPIIAGFAMAGGLVQKLAFDHPDEIKQIFLLCSVMKFNELAVNVCRQLVNCRREDRLDDYLALIYEHCFSKQFKKGVSKLAFLSERKSALRTVQTATDQARQFQVLKNFDSRSWVKNIIVTSVVIGADEDPFATMEESKALANALQAAKLYTLKSASHAALAEKLDEIEAIFLDEMKG